MIRIRSALLCFLVAWLLSSADASAQGQDDKSTKDPHSHGGLTEFIHGAPRQPSEAWLRAAGGRIYDNWWDALDRKKPEGTHPAYPNTGKRTGANTWRCVECHGWDYNGKDGLYGSGERYTGIKGIRRAAGRDLKSIMALLRGQPHNYTQEMIKDEELRRVAIFVSRGQDNPDRFINVRTGKVKGDAQRGAALFQTMCAACHGFDGRALNWGTAEAPAFIGTEANKFPQEVLHKIRNSHPGAAMINFRAFPLEDAINVLAYAQTLPTK
ncbi:MAG: c-type cytochrome [Pseudomonadota bacterium]